jgi:ATP-dependent Clp protease ATP-binding subunit ClpA
MDHFGEDTLAGIPPDLISAERADRLASDALQPAASPDIDVPFTPSAQRVIDRCLELADLVGGKAVMTEHLLLAIASTPECAAAKLIAEHDHSSENALSALEYVLGKGVAAKEDHQAGPRLERIIIRAKREAFRHRHREVSTLHLLMALIRERAGLALPGLERSGAGYPKRAGANNQFVRAGESD